MLSHIVLKFEAVVNMEYAVKYYEDICKKFPEVISKEQFRQIAHISKATALYLLQSGLVPCKQTDKKTHRYKIRTDDVIVYMIEREFNKEKYQAPDRWYSSRSHPVTPYQKYRNTLLRLSENDLASFREYITERIAEYNDLVTASDVTEMIGYSKSIVNKWCNANKLKAFRVSNRFLIPKIELANFLTSRYSFDITRKTWKHLLLIKGFTDTIDIR